MGLDSPSDFVELGCAISDLPTYWYEGYCPQSGEQLRLPRTLFVEAIAQGLMRSLGESQEGKMYGVLLVETSSGEQRVLKAFSGLLNGNRIVEGWVPPIPGRDRVAFEEAHTLATLELIKQELIALQDLPERSQYEILLQEFQTQLNELALLHNQRKNERQQQRQRLTEVAAESLEIAEQLNEQSRQDGIDRKQLKRQQNAELQPLKSSIEQADNRIRELKQQRKGLSRQLQTQMHAHYWLTNFAGKSLSLQQLISGSSMPTGTGDCCAPKLLHYAATHHLKPLAMAEFWWGLPSTNQEKVQGAFYGACAERCQPLMGFLLSGLPQGDAIALTQTLPILYEDEWLIVVNKPPGLLSVPGRYRDVQDSVLSRLRHLLPDGESVMAVHRLDRDTSGILVLARDRQTYRQLSQQFQQRQVYKVYEAMLNGSVIEEQGVIDLPLWGDPQNRPIQTVDRPRGKPSVTHFKHMARTGNLTRMEFSPVTGRTHQIRVHAADRRGLGVAILGDRLYGASGDRLHLHARELSFEHPQSKQTLQLTVDTPF
ncbi:RNA pseudouridine synthase [Phormidesmis priestleyi ULC007]|uniref:RNA pseudouridylate synthase n=2 Tax=Phormidesmis priestleyi TaxID=268141 RepID=A0A2T1DHP9_9CYAN|nr:RNA pseudouridine synthase [Phormidesmis priestleyi ULC007]PZO50391.1 MAG: RNA pseudouridine synthase [Phormidesmis priestleyi]